MTAVDMQFKELNKAFDKYDNGEINYTKFVNTILEIHTKSKLEEKRQIQLAFYDGKHHYNNWEEGPEQYYNEYYGE
jgi:hypothetical protein